MNYEEFRKIFRGKRPSVRVFNQQLSGLPPEERAEWYAAAYGLALMEFDRLPDTCRSFLVRLVQHDRDRFLEYVMGKTVLGALRCPEPESGLVMGTFALMVQMQMNHKVSFNHWGYCYRLIYDCDLKVRTLAAKLGEPGLTPEEMWEMLEYGKVVI